MQLLVINFTIKMFHTQPSIITQARSVQLLHKQNAIYTNHRISKTARMDTICTIARNDDFPLQIIHNLKNKIKYKKQNILPRKHKERNGLHLRIIAHSYIRLLTCSNAPT